MLCWCLAMFRTGTLARMALWCQQRHQGLGSCTRWVRRSHAPGEQVKSQSWFTKLEFSLLSKYCPLSPHALPRISGIGGGNVSSNDLGHDESNIELQSSSSSSSSSSPSFRSFSSSCAQFPQGNCCKWWNLCERPAFVHPPFHQVMQWQG